MPTEISEKKNTKHLFQKIPGRKSPFNTKRLPSDILGNFRISSKNPSKDFSKKFLVGFFQDFLQGFLQAVPCTDSSRSYSNILFWDSSKNIFKDFIQESSPESLLEQCQRHLHETFRRFAIISPKIFYKSSSKHFSVEASTSLFQDSFRHLSRNESNPSIKPPPILSKGLSMNPFKNSFRNGLKDLSSQLIQGHIKKFLSRFFFQQLRKI